jgi:hypothetical protein
MDIYYALDTMQSDLDFYTRKMLSDEKSDKKKLYATIEKKLSIIDSIQEYVNTNNETISILQQENTRLSTANAATRQYLSKAIRILQLIGFNEFFFSLVTEKDLDTIERIQTDLQELNFRLFMTVIMTLHRVEDVARFLDLDEPKNINQIVEFEEFADKKAIPQILEILKKLKQ